MPRFFLIFITSELYLVVESCVMCLFDKDVFCVRLYILSVYRDYEEE